MILELSMDWEGMSQNQSVWAERIEQMIRKECEEIGMTEREEEENIANLHPFPTKWVFEHLYLKERISDEIEELQIKRNKINREISKLKKANLNN